MLFPQVVASICSDFLVIFDDQEALASTISQWKAKESKKAKERSHIEADIEHEQIQVGLLMFPMAILLSKSTEQPIEFKICTLKMRRNMSEIQAQFSV